MRPATLADIPAILDAILEMRLKSPAPQMDLIEESAYIPYIRVAVIGGFARFVGGYFILFDVGSDWYTNRLLLIEQLILKVYPADKSATLDDVLAALDQIKNERGCVRIVAGDTQIGYMTPRYQAAGYHVLGTQLMK